MGAERRLQTSVLAGCLTHINLARLLCEQRLLLQLGIGAAVGLQRQDRIYVAALELEACVLELVGRSGTESVRYGVRVVQGASGVRSSSCGFWSTVWVLVYGAARSGTTRRRMVRNCITCNGSGLCSVATRIPCQQ